MVIIGNLTKEQHIINNIIYNDLNININININMSYYASNTPNPTITTQIGYTFTVPLTTSTASGSGTLVYVTTTTAAIPIGVWNISNYCFATGPAGTEYLLTTSVSISAASVFYINGYSSSTPFINMYLPLGGIFYSDGTTVINITLGTKILSGSLYTCSTSGNCSFTKIA